MTVWRVIVRGEATETYLVERDQEPTFEEMNEYIETTVPIPNTSEVDGAEVVGIEEID